MGEPSRIRIRCTGPAPKDVQVWAGRRPLQNVVEAVFVSKMNQMNICQLTVIVDDADIDGLMETFLSAAHNDANKAATNLVKLLEALEPGIKIERKVIESAPPKAEIPPGSDASAAPTKS